MDIKKKMVTSGVRYADLMLGGGIIIGDNVIWYDDAGSLASVFALNLIRASIEKKKSVIYINFDNSPKTLLEKLGPLAKYKSLVVLDCFTDGRGKGSDIFTGFYNRKKNDKICQFVRVEAPDNPDHVMGAFYGLHKTMDGDVRFIFDSVTGMQELWGGEDAILKFYSHSCPRLKELRTRKGLSQTEMAKLVGVTPSTISQVERSQIYPSLPALFKMAEILSVETGALFRKTGLPKGQVVFGGDEAVEVQLPGVARENVRAMLLTSVEHESKVEPYLIEIPPKTKLTVHFFAHKGEEFGYLLSGKLNLKLQRGTLAISEGDTVCLKSEIPQQWENKGDTPARLLWLKIK